VYILLVFCIFYSSVIWLSGGAHWVDDLCFVYMYNLTPRSWKEQSSMHHAGKIKLQLEDFTNLRHELLAPVYSKFP
jgi:hypothetical protein